MFRLWTVSNQEPPKRFEQNLSYEILTMKLLLIFINALLSITNANNVPVPDGLDVELSLERKSSGLYNVMFKPYVLELLNSRAVARLKTTPCWKNLHFLTTNRDLHYLAKLPISRALFTSRIPQFQDWLLNLRKGPSAAKGKFIILDKFRLVICEARCFLSIFVCWGSNSGGALKTSGFKIFLIF